jgi:hypothetical protein
MDTFIVFTQPQFIYSQITGATPFIRDTIGLHVIIGSLEKSTEQEFTNGLIITLQVGAGGSATTQQEPQVSRHTKLTPGTATTLTTSSI